MSRRRSPVLLALAVGLVALCALGLWVVASVPATWLLSVREGRPSARGVAVSGALVLREGDWIDTDARSRARLRVPGIGVVEVDRETRLQVREAGRPEHRVLLERGRIVARVFSRPERFRVETLAGRLIGYGGAYAVDVGAGGTGILRVTSGWAAVEWHGRPSFTPAGAACPLWTDGPGTPYFEDASAAFREALAAVDTRPADSLVRRIAVDVVASEARPRDALTLWHLGARLEPPLNGLVLDRLAGLVPPPAGVTRRGMMAGDDVMRERWFASLGLGPAPWTRISRP